MQLALPKIPGMVSKSQFSTPSNTSIVNLNNKNKQNKHKKLQYIVAGHAMAVSVRNKQTTFKNHDIMHKEFGADDN